MALKIEVWFADGAVEEPDRVSVADCHDGTALARMKVVVAHGVRVDRAAGRVIPYPYRPVGRPRGDMLRAGHEQEFLDLRQAVGHSRLASGGDIQQPEFLASSDGEQAAVTRKGHMRVRDVRSQEVMADGPR